MCTLIALFRCVEGFPLVIAANRDEFLDRPATAPRVELSPGGRLVAAPRDLRAGGTWLGLNDAGVFVGLTNRPTATPDPTRRSRGHVVSEALEAESADEAAGRLAGLRADAFNPFNVFVADAECAYTVVYANKPVVEPVTPGVHVIANAEPDDRRVPKIGRLLDRAEAAAAETNVLDVLARVCRGHEPREAHHAPRRSLEDACIHLDGYGTRSSMLLRLGDEPENDVWKWADGPPCTTPYEDITDLLRTLGRGARVVREGFEARANR